MRLPILAVLIIVTGCSQPGLAPPPLLSASAALFPNSVESNDLDFIRPSDPQASACSRRLGTGLREMPDPRRDELMVADVDLFDTLFTDGTSVEVHVHPDVPEPDVRRAHLALRLGHLPTYMRDRLVRVVVLDSDTASAEDEGRFFVIGTKRMDRRLADDDLEETVFHGSVNATLDIPYAESRRWLKARVADGLVITDYARNPQEDMAESALFARAVLRHPGRLPVDIEDRVREIMPNRLAFFQRMLDGGPWMSLADPPPDCPA